MRQNDLSFANFILRFGVEEVLLDYAAEIVIPAFTTRAYVRSYGETTYRFHDVRLSKVGDENGVPILALAGHFVKDTVLRRQQIFRGDRLVEDEAAIESAPSAFFVLILNNHRLLYFAETASAPPLEAFSTTAQHFLRLEYHNYIRRAREHENVTRRGVDRVTNKDIERRLGVPVLTVVPVAGEELIAETVQRFRTIKQIRFKLIEPNDEIDASLAVAAVEEAFRPMRPKRLEVIASDPLGLEKSEAARKVIEASQGQNTEILIDGEDQAGLKLKVDNDEFALSIAIDNPPNDDASLTVKLMVVYKKLADDGKVLRPPTQERVVDKIRRLVGLL